MTRPVSQSDILPFERCPSLWHATRVRGLDAGNRFSRIGTACHVACEAVTRGVLGEDSSRPLYLVARAAVLAHADKVDLADDEMHEALDVMESATRGGSAISFYVHDGWECAAEIDLALDAEFAPLSVLGGSAYRGRLDRLQWNAETGELEVWDWKTGEDWMSSDDVRLDVQAQWYAMLALAWFPQAACVTFRRVMLRLGYTATAKFVRGERWHERIMDRARRLHKSTNLVLDVVAASSATALPERDGGWCERCPVRGKCMTYMEAVARGSKILPNAPREFVARQLRALKGAVKELDERLREDVTAHGPISLGDGTALGFNAKRHLVLRSEPAETMAELRRLGMTDAIEREVFVPSERAMPGLVRDAIERIEKSRSMQDALVERLLAAATGFNFEVYTEDEA